jgi:carbon-monoxide dehydrogenase medium subunit
VDKERKLVRVGVTGIAAKPYRAKAVEEFLGGKVVTPENIAEASRQAAQGVEALNDIHASAEFRSHLAQVNTRRALTVAATH